MLRLNHFDSYVPEMVGLAVVAVYLVNMMVGRGRNALRAEGYARELLGPGGVVDLNFAVATGEVMATGADLFKAYATGRRHCKGMLMTFRMAARQDLLAIAVGSARRDILDVEIALVEAAMNPLVLFVGTAAAAKVVARDHADLDKLARRIEVTRDRVAAWPADVLVVQTEHSSVFYDVVGHPTFMELAFGPVAFAEVKPYFRFLHATTDYSAGEQKAMVRLSMYLPPPGDVAPLNRLVFMLMLLVDMLAGYKLTPEQLKKALDARRKIEAAKASGAEGGGSRREKRLEERRVAKEAEERARLAKLPPDQREKERARKEKIMRQRRMKQMAKKG